MCEIGNAIPIKWHCFAPLIYLVFFFFALHRLAGFVWDEKGQRTASLIGHESMLFLAIEFLLERLYHLHNFIFITSA